MRTIRQTGAFKRDLKREASGQYRGLLEELLAPVLARLAEDRRLPDKYRDHKLTGALKQCRECHIKPDLLLIYLKSGNELDLIRLGSHSQLSL